MIYLDHNATSPLLPEVLEAMSPWFGRPGNPASAHTAGQEAAMAVDRARELVADLVGGEPTGVVFTSGATEANHLFIRGVLPEVIQRGATVAYSEIEHPCVKAACEHALAMGGTIHPLPVGIDGRATLPADYSDIGLLCLMAANHETGILQDISGAIQWSREHHALLHIDATQAAGRVPLELGEVSGVALSAHKLGGPSGVGALLLQHGEAFPALITGGSQERGRRAGTVNTAGVVGFGEACRIAKTRMADRQRRWSTFRDQMAKSVVGLGGTVIGDHVVQNTLCAVFGGLTAESIVQAMDLRGVCISAGAACSSGSLEVSPVLRAMGVDHPGSGVRFSFGDATSQTEVSEGIMILNQVVTALRAFDDEEWEAGL